MGFRIGYDYSKQQGLPTQLRRNMMSAHQNPQVIEAYLESELRKGRIIGPFSRECIPDVRVSPFGVIPKSKPGTWRLITNLSSPEGSSVNDGIDKSLCSIRYMSVDDVFNLVKALGKGTLLAKLDLKEAYRVVPVHPEDRPLLGVEWEGRIYTDTALPFSL